MKLKIGSKRIFDEAEYPGLVPFGISSYYFFQKGDKGVAIDLKDAGFLYLEGSLFYYLDNSQKPHFVNIKDTTTIERLYLSLGFSDFVDRIEGRFVGALVDNKNKSITAFCDKFGRNNLFYSSSENNHVFSTNVSDITSQVKHLEYNQLSLYSLFSIRYCPAKHTIYEGIHKLGPMQRAEYKNGAVDIKSDIVPKYISEYRGEEIETYENMVKNSIISRSSSSENWVMLTGGLDTSIIFDHLLREYDRGRVKGVIATRRDKSGAFGNSHDVDRAKKIADFYGAQLEVVEVGSLDKNMHDYFERNVEILREESFVGFGSAYYALADFLENRIDKNGVVFTGESADSLMNFGFTKSKKHDFLILNEIENQVKNYHYTPSFFKQVRDNKFKPHVLYKLYRSLLGIPGRYSQTDNSLMDYLFSFVYSDDRVPFAKTKVLDDICVESGLAVFKEWLYKHYFEDVIKQVTENTLYFWLTFIYLNFHLQGRNNNIISSAFHRRNIDCRIPYFDMQIVDFLSKMPPHWGRTLGVRRTKYPSQVIARKYSKIPMRIVDSLDNRAFRRFGENANRDLAVKSKYALERLKLVMNTRDIAEGLSDKYFDLDYIEEMIGRFLAGPSDAGRGRGHLHLLYTLACLRRL